MTSNSRRLASKRIDLPDSLEELYEYISDRRLGDGLPVVPPTEERVWKFIDYVGKKPDEVLGEMPPAYGEASIEKIAINAVMAGCLPQYMPVILAAVEAMLEPEFNLNGIQVTTNPVAPLAIINGPIRHTLDINCGMGCLGPGWRSNATIGRAIRLILTNIGGAVPDVGSKSIHGMPARYSFCFGEDEEGSPWEPLHVERGFDKQASTVTMVGPQDIRNCHSSTPTPKTHLLCAADTMATVGSNNMLAGHGEPVLILTRGHAAVLSEAGYSKHDCKQVVFENAWVPVEAMLDNHPASTKPMVVDGKVFPCERAEDIMLVIAGGPLIYHLQVMGSFAETKAVTKIIATP